MQGKALEKLLKIIGDSIPVCMQVPGVTMRLLPEFMEADAGIIMFSPMQVHLCVIDHLIEVTSPAPKG